MPRGAATSTRLNHVLVLEDVGSAGDFTSIYADGVIPASVVGALLEWLEQLGHDRNPRRLDEKSLPTAPCAR